MNKFDELYENILSEAAPKDMKRIEDIITKSKGDPKKQIKLATSMATKIKKKDKSLSRYEAAVQILGDANEITKIFAQRASELGNYISVTKSKDNDENTPFSILRKKCKMAYDKYVIPKSLYEDGEEYVTYSSQRGSDKIEFFNPWSMYFWNANMIGQMSDGYWENSTKYQDSWRYWTKLKPVFNKSMSSSVPSDVTSGVQNPKKVQKWAIQNQAEFDVMGKIVTLNNSKLLKLIPLAYKLSYEMKDFKDILEVEKYAHKYDIDPYLFQVFLYTPITKKSTVKKIIGQAHTDMLTSMLTGV